MKANAPEEIYLLPDDRNSNGLSICWYDAPYRTGGIEYIRTDAFIEKAIKYVANHFLAPGMDNEIKDFVNYMEGE